MCGALEPALTLSSTSNGGRAPTPLAAQFAVRRLSCEQDILKEPFLNIVAAAAQMSSFTHVEIAIGRLRPPPHTHRTPRTSFRILNGTGSEAGSFGQMCNVCRIFNDDVSAVTGSTRSRALL